MCPNTCQADGAEWRKAQAEMIERAEEGSRLRQRYSDEGIMAIAELQAKKLSLEASIATVTDSVKKAEEEMRSAEEEEGKVQEAAKATAAVAPSDSLSRALAGLGLPAPSASEIVTHALTAGNRYEFENSLKTAMGIDPSAVDKPAEEAASEPPAEAPADSGIVYLPKGWPTASIEDLWQAVHQAGSQKTEAATSARTRHETLKSEQSRLEGELSGIRESENFDFGPDSSFFPLKGKCFDLRVNQYTYTVCPFGSAKQDGTNLGNFESWGKRDDGTTDYSVMKFTNGQYCWNGPHRSLKVNLSCGSFDAVLKVDEPEKCTYAADFQTPAACDGKYARELRLELEGSGDDAYEQKTEL